MFFRESSFKYFCATVKHEQITEFHDIDFTEKM